MDTSELRRKEWEVAIKGRRKQAGFKAPDAASEATAKTGECPPDDLVGLALSGGGLRSAAFNLGLVQALHKSGILRFVDYLSSVSGGSYVGAMVSESVAQEKGYGKDSFEIKPEAGGKQPERVLNIAKRGNYLCRLDLLANRYVIGLLLNLIPRLALVIAVGAGVAFLWRLLDLHWVRDRLGGLGISGDVIPTILPAICALLLWFLLCVAALIFQSRPLKVWSNRIFWITVLFFAVSATVLVGNGDISLSRNFSENLSENRIFWQEHIRTPLVILVLLGLVPMIFPRRLLQSGAAPRGTVESWVFYYTSFALFLGIPLCAIGWFARENISGFATHRGPDLVYGDLKDVGAFCDLMTERAGLLVVVDHPYGDDEDDQDGVVFRFRPPLLRVSPIPDELLPRRLISDSEPPRALTPTYLAGSIDHLDQIRTNLMLDSMYPPTDGTGQPAGREPFAEVPSERWHVATASSGPHWLKWRYLSFVPRLQYFAYSVFGHPRNEYAGYVEWSSLVRGQESELLRVFNNHLRQCKHPIFGLYDPNVAKIRIGAVSGFEHRIAEERVPPAIAELIRHFVDHDGRLSDERQRAELNRFLLVEGFPEVFRPRAEIRRTTLIHPDQWHRLFWFVGASIVFLVSSWLLNPNTTSLHEYYRDRLSVAFLKAGQKHGNEPYPKISHMQLYDCRPDKHGAPYPLFGAAVADGQPWWIHPDQLEPPFKSFLLSPLYSGIASENLGETKEIPEDELTVADAMAISGAALSPNYFVHHIVTAVMSVLNLRMGKWLPRIGGESVATGRLSFLSLLGDDWRSYHKRPRRYALTSDGGHAENLGLEVLLERRCRLIIVSDAGQDSDYGFDDLARLWRRYHATTGVELLDLEDDRALHVTDQLPRRPLARGDGRKDKESERAEESIESLRQILQPAGDADSHRRRHFFCARIRYNDNNFPGDGLLVYIKPCLTGDEDLDIFNFALRHREFPHEPTSDQAFSFAQFEAYRRLGYHTGEDVSRPWLDASTFEASQTDFSLWKPQIEFDVNLLIDQFSATLGRGESAGSKFSPSLDDSPRAQSPPQNEPLPQQAFSVDLSERVFELLRSKLPDDVQQASAYLSEFGADAPSELRRQTVNVLIAAYDGAVDTASRESIYHAVRQVGEKFKVAKEFLKSRARDSNELELV